MNSNAPSPAPASALRYDRTAITFHWITVILVVVVGVLGLLHDSWPKRSQAFWINVHALIGLTLWLLVMARLWWRRAHRPPALPPESGAWSQHLSAPVHWLMYGLLLVTPVLGIITFIWHGRVFDFGLFRVDFGVAAKRAIFHPTEDIHGYLAYALFTLVGLHVLAALWHHYARRDGVLLRMWPMRVPPA